MPRTMLLNQQKINFWKASLITVGLSLSHTHTHTHTHTQSLELCINKAINIHMTQYVGKSSQQWVMAAIAGKRDHNQSGNQRMCLERMQDCIGFATGTIDTLLFDIPYTAPCSSL